MAVLPPPSTFAPGSRSNADAANWFNEWLEFQRNSSGGSAEFVTATGGWFIPSITSANIYVLNAGGAAEGFVDGITTSTDIQPLQVIRIRMANFNQKFYVRSGISNIILSNGGQMRFGETGWESLWLEFNGTQWVEVDRAYGVNPNANFMYNWRYDHGLAANNPIPPYPATWSAATNAEAQAGVSNSAAMSPATVTQAIATAALMIDNRGLQTGLNAGMYFLISLGGVLYKLNLLTLLSSSFSSYVETGELSVAAGAGGFFAHGIASGQPNLVRGYFRCKADDGGFQAGFEIPAECLCSDVGTRRVTFGATPTNAFWRMTNTGNLIMTDRTSGNDITLTNASWRFFMRLWR